MEYFNISYTAVLSEETDRVSKLTPLYTQAVNYSMYRFVFGLKSIITPDMLVKNLAVVQHDYNYEKHNRLIEEIKKGNLKAAESVLVNLIEDVRKLEYNNMMLSLAYVISRKDFRYRNIRALALNIEAMFAVVSGFKQIGIMAIFPVFLSLKSSFTIEAYLALDS